MASCHIFFCLALLIALSFSTLDSALGKRSLLKDPEPSEQSLFKQIPKFKFPLFPPKFSKPFGKPFFKPKFKFPPKFKLPPLETTKHVQESSLKPVPGVSDTKTFLIKPKLPPKFKLPGKKFPPKFTKPAFKKPEFPPKIKFPPQSLKASKPLEQSLFPTIPGVPALPGFNLPPFPTVPTPTFPNPDAPVLPGGLPLTPPAANSKAP